MLLAFAVLKFLPDKPQHASWLTENEKAIIAAGLAMDDTSEQRNFWLALRDPRVYALGIVYFGYSMSFYGVGLWLPQIVQGMGVSNLATGFVIAPSYVVALVAMILWGRSSDKSGERSWHVALPAIMMAASLLVASQVHSNLVIFLALSLVLVGSMALQGPFWVLPSAFLGGSAAAGGIALINTMGTAAGGFAGPYILGLLKTPDGGYALGMATLSIGPILTASIVLILGRAAAQRKLRAASAG
jgi:ACS family tartrate transporter-like MFS transporter